MHEHRYVSYVVSEGNSGVGCSSMRGVPCYGHSSYTICTLPVAQGIVPRMTYQNHIDDRRRVGAGATPRSQELQQG